MGKAKDNSGAAVSIADLSAAQAYSVGAAVGELLKDGLSGERAIDATAQIADFIRRGVAAQCAVDEIIASENLKRHR